MISVALLISGVTLAQNNDGIAVPPSYNMGSTSSYSTSTTMSSGSEYASSVGTPFGSSNRIGGRRNEGEEETLPTDLITTDPKTEENPGLPVGEGLPFMLMLALMSAGYIYVRTKRQSE